MYMEGHRARPLVLTHKAFNQRAERECRTNGVGLVEAAAITARAGFHEISTSRPF